MSVLYLFTSKAPNIGVYHVSYPGEVKTEEEGLVVLRESFTFPLEQTVASLSSLEFRLHQPQRLPRGENGLPILRNLVNRHCMTPGE